MVNLTICQVCPSIKWWNFRFISFNVRVKHRRGLGTRREDKRDAVSVKGRRRNGWVNFYNSYVIAHGCLSTDFFLESISSSDAEENAG